MTRAMISRFRLALKTIYNDRETHHKKQEAKLKKIYNHLKSMNEQQLEKINNSYTAGCCNRKCYTNTILNLFKIIDCKLSDKYDEVIHGFDIIENGYPDADRMTNLDFTGHKVFGLEIDLRFNFWDWISPDGLTKREYVDIVCFDANKGAVKCIFIRPTGDHTNLLSTNDISICQVYSY